LGLAKRKQKRGFLGRIGRKNRKKVYDSWMLQMELNEKNFELKPKEIFKVKPNLNSK
jgi:hypothetical protein